MSEPQSPTEQPVVTHSNVYVKNIPDEVDDDGLKSIFAEHGPITSACVMVDQVTQKSRNFGFVKFEDVACAEKAILAMNNFQMMGKKLVVKSADADTDEKPTNVESDNLYVKGLPLNMSQEQLHTMFAKYGNVSQLKILSRPGVGSTGEALVRMATVEQAAWSVQNLHMTTPPDGVQPILVRFADTPDDKQTRRRASTRVGGGVQPSGGPAGPLPMPGNMMAHRVGGMGFQPNFPGRPIVHGHEGFMPLMHLMGDPWGSHANLHQPQFPIGMNNPGHDAIHMNNVGGHASDMCNLYVNDLPPGADDLWMYRTFSPYGAISSVRVMKDESGLSRGFGFVMFVLVQDAVNAIEAVNGKLFKGKPVHVSHKTASKQNQQQQQMQMQQKQMLAMHSPPHGQYPMHHMPGFSGQPI